MLESHGWHSVLPRLVGEEKPDKVGGRAGGGQVGSKLASPFPGMPQLDVFILNRGNFSKSITIGDLKLICEPLPINIFTDKNKKDPS